MFDTALILSASAGAGHVRAAQALERAFTQSGLARRVHHVDTLELTTKTFRELYSRAYLEMVNRTPDVLGWLYDRLDEPFKHERLRLALSKLNTRPFVRMLESHRADITVCTHFLPAEIISWLKAKQRLACPMAIVVTDLDVHAMWLCRRCDHYFVALDETRVHLEKLGVPSRSITVSGIPIDPVFADSHDPCAMRERLGLDPEMTTILLSAGGFGVGPIEHLLASLLEMKHAAQVVAICGRNQELVGRVEQVAAAARGGAVRLHPIGYTTEMDKYMSAADLLLGKPGGLTTSEALAKGLAMVIVNPIPGQEERNADHLLEEGVAIRCNNLPALAFKLDRLLDDPARLAAMRADARRLGKPHAARTIVETLARWRTDDTPNHNAQIT